MSISKAHRGTIFGGLALFQYVTLRKKTREAVAERGYLIADERDVLFGSLKKAGVLHAIFWILGSDQLGFLMNPKIKLGLGKRIARSIYLRIPESDFLAVTLKLLEIMSDEARSRVEIWMASEYGYSVDAWATFLTPEVWRCIEVPEKVMGVILAPERMLGEGMELTIQNIYGNLFRMLMVGVMYLRGDDIDYFLSELTGS